MRVSQTDTGTQIAAQGLSDGAWKGTFNFTITKKLSWKLPRLRVPCGTFSMYHN